MVESYREQINQVNWSLCALAIVAVLARCYCRYLVLHKFGWDDGFMVLALAFSICMSGLVTIAVNYGYGLHLADITDPYNREQALKYTYVSPPVAILASTAGKISMVFFLLRLLGHSAGRGYRWFLFSMTGIMISLNVYAIGTIVGQCTPVEKSWKPWVSGKCLSLGWLDIGGRIQAIWNGVMDLITALFPVYMVWNLQLKTSTKWGLSSLMGGGVFAAAATFIKVYYMRELTKLADVTYAWAPLAPWYIAEVNVLIIMGSLPTLKPILSQLRNLMPSLSSYVPSKKHSSRYSTHEENIPTTIGSKSFKGFGHRKAGSVTLALEEIDKMTKRTRHEAGSSTESILGTITGAKDKVFVLNSDPSGTSKGMLGRSPKLSGIQVEKEYRVEHAKRAENDADFQPNILPLGK